MSREQNQQISDIIQRFVHTYVTAIDDIRMKDVFNIAGPDTIARLRDIGFSGKGKAVEEVFEEMISNVYNHQAIMQHPRCFAFIPSPVSLLSWLGDIMTSAYNPHAGSWLQSSAASFIEKEVIGWMCDLAGYSEISGGLFTSGGSISNLTALAAARHVKLSEKEYTNGTAYVSSQTHSSVTKGLRILGFRTDQIRRIPSDDCFRMDMVALEKAVVADRKAGKKPFAVIATAGTTNTGSIDPLNEIADLCERHNIWLHVDGAYGASVLVSSKHNHLLEGISRADSISWDAHKWLMQTYGCSALLVKDRKHLRSCFSTASEYLKDATTDEEEMNYWDLGIELTRPARSLKLWLTMQVLGIDVVGAVIDHGFRLAEWAEDEIKQHNHWEIISPAQLAIINFRYAPPGLSDKQQDSFNKRISQDVLKSGYASVLTTEINGRTVLRICAIHPNTTEEEMRSTIRLVSQIARNLNGEAPC
ncbi:L-2,4-diaminobutyrate decarboxylase [compost metagenome]